MRLRLSGGLGAGLLAAALVGCTSSAAPPTRTPSSQPSVALTPPATPTTATTTSPVPSPSSAATASSAASATVTATPQSAVRHIVIDTDMAPDDWMAILYLLNRDDVSVDAITVTGVGESHCAPGVEHAAGLVALARGGQQNIPIACGRETPLKGDHAFPDPWRADVDDLIGLSLPKGDPPPTDATATELMAQAIQASPSSVTILTLGPLTNVAELMQADPGLRGKVSDIFAMGGSVTADGNVGPSLGIDNQYAEWNIYADPLAAKTVLEGSVPVTLIPLDATNDVPVTETFANEIASDPVTDSREFVGSVLDARMPFIKDGTYFFWDPFAAAVMTDYTLTTYESALLTVETAEGADSGRIIPSTTGPVVRYATSGDKARFEREFLDTLNSHAAID